MVGCTRTVALIEAHLVACSIEMFPIVIQALKKLSAEQVNTNANFAQGYDTALASVANAAFWTGIKDVSTSLVQAA